MAEAGGKIILFGEHFVVHNAPAIAAGISNKSIVEVSPSEEYKITTDQQVIPELSKKSIRLIHESMGIMEKHEVFLKGDLPTYGGLGSSAAFCVALVKALAEKNDISLSKDEINRHAYQGERAFHGNPSGIDNTVATHGGVVEFKKDRGFEFFKIEKPLDIVISFTGIYGPTSKTVESVKKFKEDDERAFSQLMDEYIELEIRAKKALLKYQLDTIGNCMNENQTLLSEIGVSDEKNDEITMIALDNNALGSKLTGGGGGGCCISLAESQEAANEICKKLNDCGYQSFLTKIN